jgi:hypothetical protein
MERSRGTLRRRQYLRSATGTCHMADETWSVFAGFDHTSISELPATLLQQMRTQIYRPVSALRPEWLKIKPSPPHPLGFVLWHLEN